MAFIECRFASRVLGKACSMNVILPEPPAWDQPAAGSRAQRRWPVLYLLHGLSDDDSIWQRRTSIERHAAPFKLAVVMPDAGRSFYADMPAGPRYWAFISGELPHVARALFPISARREENYAAGLSMGGYGAFKLALSHPERFAAAASLSGALDVERLLKKEAGEGGCELRGIFGGARGFKNSPSNLFRLAERLARGAGPKPALYQWCGTEDFLYQDNCRFKNRAETLGLPLTHEEGPGGHDWACWDRQIQRVLEWLPGLRKRE